MPDKIARKVRVYGRVQGVFFRQWTVNQARALGVSGWVRNCADGSVEALLEGVENSVEGLIAAMRSGPPQARVEDLSVNHVKLEELSGFSVRH